MYKFNPLLESSTFDSQLDVINPIRVNNNQKNDICFLLNQLKKDHIVYNKALNLSVVNDNSKFSAENYNNIILQNQRIEFQRFFICSLNDKIVGLIHYVEYKEGLDEYKEKCGWFTNIIVHPKFRKMGIGSKLMELAKSWIKKNRPSIMIFLGVSCGNPGGMALYSKYGFKPVHQTMICKI